jgi:spoIIIJ-associated protein
VEWVETTGKSLDEAKDAALDELGIDESDAEFEILEEPKTGLFGRVRGEARIRARIRPAQPRPKVERRERRPRDGSRGKKGNGAGGGGGNGAKGGRKPSSANRAPAAEAEAVEAPAAELATAPASSRSGGGTDRPAPARSRSRGPRNDPKPAAEAASDEGTDMTDDDVTVEEQAELTATFLGGLVDAFGLEGKVEQVRIDEDTMEVQVVGDDLGLLIGVKGQTLTAVQELSRTYVQRKATGIHHGRVRIDVGGYRQRRREALERFTRQVAEQVVETGVQKVLEPMPASERKVVHDTANSIDGVRTLSEGEEPRRRVVIAPA